MKISLDTPLWLVTDPTEDSEFIDILSEGTLEDFINIVRGTSHYDFVRENPTLFTDSVEAEKEANRRFNRGSERSRRANTRFIRSRRHRRFRD